MGKLFLPTMLKVSWSILSTASTDDYTEIVFDSVVLVVNICSQPQMDPSDKKKDGTWDSLWRVRDFVDQTTIIPCSSYNAHVASISPLIEYHSYFIL